MANKFKTGDRVQLTQRWALLSKGRVGTVLYTMQEKHPKTLNPPEEYGCNFDGFGEAVWLKPEQLELVDLLERSENAQDTRRDQKVTKGQKTPSKGKEAKPFFGFNTPTEEDTNPFSDLSQGHETDRDSSSVDVP